MNQRNFFQNLLHYWNLFLDSTPRQWGNGLKNLFLSFFSLFHPRNLKENFIESLGNRFILGSLILHGILFLSLDQLHEKFGTENVLELGQQGVIEIEVEAFTENVTLTDDNSDIYYDDPEYIKKVKKLKKEQKSRMGTLLSRLERLKNKNLSHNKKQQTTSHTQPKLSFLMKPRRKIRKIKPIPSPRTTLDHLKIKNSITKKKKTGVQQGDLLKIIQKEESRFKNCYEKALLKDQTLGGQVQFTVLSSPKGKVEKATVQFKGKGSQGAQDYLKNCLINQAKSIPLPRNIKRSKIKFNLLMI